MAAGELCERLVGLVVFKADAALVLFFFRRGLARLELHRLLGRHPAARLLLVVVLAPVHDKHGEEQNAARGRRRHRGQVLRPLREHVRREGDGRFFGGAEQLRARALLHEDTRDGDFGAVAAHLDQILVFVVKDDDSGVASKLRVQHLEAAGV